MMQGSEYPFAWMQVAFVFWLDDFSKSQADVIRFTVLVFSVNFRFIYSFSETSAKKSDNDSRSLFLLLNFQELSKIIHIFRGLSLIERVYCMCKKKCRRFKKEVTMPTFHIYYGNLYNTTDSH